MPTEDFAPEGTASESTAPKRPRLGAAGPESIARSSAPTPRSRTVGALSLGLIAIFALGACGSQAEAEEPEATEGEAAEAEDAEGEAEGEDAATVTIEDDHGTHEVSTDPQSVVVTDNRSYRTLEAFGVEPTAAARSLMDAQTHDWAEDESILDLGNHREPDLENVVAAEPDLIINGQRFQQYYQDLGGLAPEATILEFEPQEDADLVEELIRKTESLGEVFGEEGVAAELVEELEAEMARVQDAYDGESTVMGLLTSGGDMSYVAPGPEGRSIGPVFDTFDLTPALEQEGENESHGDDISVEAIATANPDWLLVLDREARLSLDEGEEYSPAAEIVEESAALANVSAVENDQIVYLPENFYLTEDIQAYTEFFRDFADALEAAE
ncbi:iron ABC transporter substrate-binding protein [Nesterenkonia sp. AN1]|uniref:siderophore ABC transporter substrate-binding protein n=1 Tax=Nesterenkonia sp. AN1 TaxID=652017 RepID=UPI0004515FFB|nr:ABC transporter substrate-binding protein [Nesterenkonia sp. AN1]EXF26205.1 iron ABC transporter substrate-binding protein [Nesterenkonia sp. AN1]